MDSYTVAGKNFDVDDARRQLEMLRLELAKVDPGEANNPGLAPIKEVLHALEDFIESPSQEKAQEIEARARTAQDGLSRTVKMGGRTYKVKTIDPAKKAKIEESCAKSEQAVKDGKFLGADAQLLRVRNQALLAFLNDPSQENFDEAARTQGLLLSALRPKWYQKPWVEVIRAGYAVILDVPTSARTPRL